MTKINPDQAERFTRYFDGNIISQVLGTPIDKPELRREMMKQIRDVARQLSEDLDKAPSSAASFPRDTFTNSVSMPGLQKNLEELEETLSDFILEAISENTSLIAHGEMGRMLKRLADKFSKMNESWETAENFVDIARKVAQLDLSTLRTKGDIHKDYMAVRAMYEQTRILVESLFPGEEFPSLPVRPGNFSDDVNIPVIPDVYYWLLPNSPENFSPVTGLEDTPFFILALRYGFIDGQTEKYDIVNFMNDVFEKFALPSLMGMYF